MGKEWRQCVPKGSEQGCREQLLLWSALIVWVCFGGHHEHLSLGCSCLPAGRKGRWGIGRWKGWNSFRRWQGIIREQQMGKKQRQGTTDTSGHRLVVLALPLCPEELLSLQASVVAATSWARFSLPIKEFWWRAAASSKLPRWHGKSACCQLFPIQGFYQHQIHNDWKYNSRQDCLQVCSLREQTHLTNGRWLKQCRKGSLFQFNSCFSPKIHEYLAKSVGKPWNKPCYIFNEKLPCLNLCVGQTREDTGSP